MANEWINRAIELRKSGLSYAKIVKEIEKAFNIIEQLYKNSTISLDRKFNRYKEFAVLFRDK